MNFEDIKNYLIKIQQESFQTKILNAILSCFEQIEALKSFNNQTRDKINEIIDVINKNAETVNNDIQEDVEKEKIVEEDGDALEDEPPHTEE